VTLLAFSAERRAAVRRAAATTRGRRCMSINISGATAANPPHAAAAVDRCGRQFSLDYVL